MVEVGNYVDYLDSPIGIIKIVATYNCIIKVELVNSVGGVRKNNVTENCKKQLVEYFDGVRTCFDLKFELNVSEFKFRLYNEISKIPYGETMTYKELAIAIGGENYIRAVSSQIGKNPLLIIVPCHRVVGARQELVGYAGGVEAKRFLLDLESGLMQGGERLEEINDETKKIQL